MERNGWKLVNHQFADSFLELYAEKAPNVDVVVEKYFGDEVED